MSENENNENFNENRAYFWDEFLFSIKMSHLGITINA